MTHSNSLKDDYLDTQTLVEIWNELLSETWIKYFHLEYLSDNPQLYWLSNLSDGVTYWFTLSTYLSTVSCGWYLLYIFLFEWFISLFGHWHCVSSFWNYSKWQKKKLLQNHMFKVLITWWTYCTTLDTKTTIA